MASPDYDSPISVIEDLDPDPPVNGSRLRRRELLLGLLLVLGVLAWSGAQWWNQQEMEREYMAGQLAASARDWDSALTYYTAAGGYKDSSDRASEATRLIKQRDDSYRLLNEAIQKADWLTALNLVGSVRSVQPQYQDIDKLDDRALRSIYTEDLAGAIVLRVGANPAGLYFRSPDGWQWLEKSDRFSSVRGLGPSGIALYDVPAAGWTPSFSTPPDQSQPFYYVPESGSPDLRGRSLMALTSGATGLHFIPLVLDPSLYNSYVVGDRGVWALRYRGPNSTSSDPKVQALLHKSQAGITPSLDIAYQAFGTGITSTVGIDPGGQLLGYSPDGEHILLSEQFDMPGTGPACQLFVADAKGIQRRLIYTTSGHLQTAAFSLNNNYVLATTSRELPDQAAEQSAVILATDGSLPPRIMLQSRSTSPAANSLPLLDARFLTADAFAGKVLVVGWNDGTSTVNIYDPASAGEALLSVQVPGRSASRLYVGEAPGEDTILLAWHNGSGGVWPDADSITLARISPGGRRTEVPIATSRLPINLGEGLWDVQARDGYLIYTTAARKVSADTEAAFLVRSLPLSQIGTEAPKSVLLYQGDAGLVGTAGVQSWNLGSHLLAFSKWGQLSVTSYGGASTIMLDNDATLLTVPPAHPSK